MYVCRRETGREKVIKRWNDELIDLRGGEPDRTHSPDQLPRLVTG